MDCRGKWLAYDESRHKGLVLHALVPQALVSQTLVSQPMRPHALGQRPAAAKGCAAAFQIASPAWRFQSRDPRRQSSHRELSWPPPADRRPRGAGKFSTSDKQTRRRGGQFRPPALVMPETPAQRGGSGARCHEGIIDVMKTSFARFGGK